MKISEFILPLIITLIIIHGIVKKVDIFSAFIEGAKTGLKNAYEICPALIILLVSIGMFRSSGGIEMISNALSTVAQIIGFPVECISLAILRPISGSGSLALLEDILQVHGADSLAGTVASVLVASTETTFYVFAVYFASVKVKKTRYTLLASLTGDFVGIFATAFVVSILF